MSSTQMFFSTIARVTAAVIGFIATIGIAIHQLEIREKRSRTQDLRENLVNMKNKYRLLMFEIAEMIDYPFEKRFVPVDNQIDINESSAEDIINADNELFENPTHNKISMLLIKCGRILGSIDPSESPKENNLISKREITDLQKSCSYIYEKTSGTGSPLLNEYDKQLSSRDVKLSSDIFSGYENENYTNIERWIMENIEYQGLNEQINGSNVISVAKIFERFESDMNDISKMSGNTILDDETKLIHNKIPPVGLFITGIILPLCGLMIYPDWLPTLSRDLVFIYQISLIISSLVFGYLTISQIFNQQ